MHVMLAVVSVLVNSELDTPSRSKYKKETERDQIRTSISPTCPSPGRPGHSRNKGKKSSPCILVRLGLDRTREDGDKVIQKVIQEGKVDKKISRTSPSILVRLGLDKPPTAVQKWKRKNSHEAKEWTKGSHCMGPVPLSGRTLSCGTNPHLKGTHPRLKCTHPGRKTSNI